MEINPGLSTNIIFVHIDSYWPICMHTLPQQQHHFIGHLAFHPEKKTYIQQWNIIHKAIMWHPRSLNSNPEGNIIEQWKQFGTTYMMSLHQILIYERSQYQLSLCSFHYSRRQLVRIKAHGPNQPRTGSHSCTISMHV